MRILHFSDPHISACPLFMAPCHWLSKRSLGGINLMLRRRRCFAGAEHKLAALARFKDEHGVDLVVCSGDYTALGLRREYERAREAVERLMDAPLGYVNVPGNHDLYVKETLMSRHFARFFGDTLASDLDMGADGPWPLVRLPAPGVAVVAVNSARPRPLLRSNGCIPPGQLEALRAILAHPAMEGRFVFILTHYAPLLANGRADRKHHGLDNWQEFLQACPPADRGVILCGHVHRLYHVMSQDRRAIFCAGSLSMEGREGFWLLDLEPGLLRAVPGIWRGNGFALDSSNQVLLKTAR